MTQPSAKPNRDFADELLEAARAELHRQAELRRQLERADDRKHGREHLARTREQIEATKQNGREDNGERLRELAREHYDRTGTGGGAI